MMKNWILPFLIIVLTQNTEAANVKKVRIDFVEALAPTDTTSSDRFQKDYEGAIELGKNLLAPKLKKCGYTVETKASFYAASDALKAKEIATQINKEDSWVIVGPRRSNHYLLLVQGSPEIPTISLMASADNVATLGSLHTSLSPTNSEMAQIDAEEVQSRKGRTATYATVLSDDCVNCVDFGKAFDVKAKQIGLKKLGEIKINGETFDVQSIRKTILDWKPSVVLLPNYSKVASSVMSAFNDVKHPPLFVGGDGWGDNRYGFVQSGQPIEKVTGLTVRGFPPTEQGLARFPLGRESLKNSKTPFSAPSMAILKIMDVIASSLCAQKPDSKEKFKALFPTAVARPLKSPWGVSIYDLKAGELNFKTTRSIKKE